MEAWATVPLPAQPFRKSKRARVATRCLRWRSDGKGAPTEGPQCDVRSCGCCPLHPPGVKGKHGVFSPARATRATPPARVEAPSQPAPLFFHGIGLKPYGIPFNAS